LALPSLNLVPPRLGSNGAAAGLFRWRPSPLYVGLD
jgi:hypothetical protein